MEIRRFYHFFITAFFTLSLVGSAAGQSPPKGSKQFGRHWYQVEKRTNRPTWREAQEVAESRGGYLVCIESPEELRFIKGLTKPDGTWRFWTGAYRSTDGWIWISGKPVSPSFKIEAGSRDRMSMSKARSGRKFFGEFLADKIGGFIIEYSPGEKVNLVLPSAPKAKKSGKSEEPEPSGPISGNPHAPDIPIKRSQTQVNGLLVMSLGGSGEHAGAASPMTLSALRGDPSAPATIQFNQSVGATMQKALAEVVKFIEVRHDAWPRGRKMEISFENKYNPKDGPSAAVACALLLESAINGHDLDPSFAVTGDLNADGSVQPIGGVDAKIRGADNRNCTHVAIPVKNSSAVYDSVLMDGFALIAEIQVFAIATFDQADALARLEREESIQQSMDSFKKVADLYEKHPQSFAQSLKHPKVIEILQEILRATPNHLSAEILLKHAAGKAPQTLSLHGSTAYIESKAFSITDVIENGKVSEIESLSADQVSEAISLLRGSREKLDSRVWRWAAELINFGTLLNQLQRNPPSAVKSRNRLVGQINAAGDSVRVERRKLFSNPEVMEELLQ